MAATKSKTITSLYAGELLRENTKLPACKTVGELAAVLGSLPSTLPLDSEGILPVWVNIGKSEFYMPEHLNLEVDDGTFDG